MRNSVGTFARTLYTTRELHLKNTQQILEMMRVEKGVVFEEAVPSWAVEGSMVKKERYEHKGTNLKTGEVEVIVRTKMRVVDSGVREFSEANLKLVTDKFWTQE